MTTALVLIGLLTLLAFGVPVGFAMLITGSVGLYALVGFDALQGVLDSSPLSVASAFEFLTIPLFLLMAEFVLRSGKVDDLFRATAAWVGELRGGLGMATALAGAGFGAICGTSTASAATLSATSLPAMIRQGYHPSFAAGVVAISGTLAMLIPPSVAMIVYGLLANVDIGKLLIAGIFPGLLVMGTIIGTVYILATRNPEHAPSVGRVSWAEKLSMLRSVLPILLLFGVVTSVIYLGVATPTEAAAVGASGAFLLMASCGKLTRTNLLEALNRAAHGSGMIIVILIGATVFGYFFALTQVTQNLVGWVGNLDAAPWVILVCVLFGYIVLGAFLDQIAILVLTVPVVVPLMASLDYDLIWFGVLVIVTAELGMVTPPVGLNCFIVARYADRPLGEVFRGVAPHFFAHVIAIALLALLPQITLLLPSLMK